MRSLASPFRIPLRIDDLAALLPLSGRTRYLVTEILQT